MACVNVIRSWTTAILHSFSQETDLLMKVIMKCVNIKLWDILGCFHYILNAPRMSVYLAKNIDHRAEIKKNSTGYYVEKYDNTPWLNVFN